MSFASPVSDMLQRANCIEDELMGMNGLSASAPTDVLHEKFGIPVDGIVTQAKFLLEQGK